MIKLVSNILRIIKDKTVPLCVYGLFSLFSHAQEVIATIDTTEIKIGEEIKYKIRVETDTINYVIFPEGQTFQPLEVINSYSTDTTVKSQKKHLIKTYGLTQFDSGSYTIPRQKIIIGDNTVFTDSLLVSVKSVEIDTTRQKLFDIKPIFEVQKPEEKWLKYVLLTLAILGLVGFLLYWFIWRERPLTEEEKIALLPPYDRAKLALKQLDDSAYLKNRELKAYYSDLTEIIKKYLDQKVYDQAMESTTNQLISRLQLLKEANQLQLSRDTISNIKIILERADLVKFAKSKPDFDLAKIDRNTIDLEIDHVKNALPEPTEEELLADEEYQEMVKKKKKRKKLIITISIVIFLFITTFLIFTINYGFTYVKDTIIGHKSKELLETKEWVTSEYGVPGVTITTPKVLKRIEIPIPDELKDKAQITGFGFGGINSTIDIVVVNTKVGIPNNTSDAEGQSGKDEFKIDLLQIAEEQLKQLEVKGAQNILPQNEPFTTPNGQEGLKTYGTADFKIPLSGNLIKVKFVILGFTTRNIVQQVILIWNKDDRYADQISQRILASVELDKIDSN